MARRVDSWTNRCLDQVVQRLKLPSDYALADVLGVSSQAVYKMRGGGAMSTTTAAKIADLLGADPLKFIAECQLERGADRELWIRIRDAAGIAFGAVGAVLLLHALGYFDLTIIKLSFVLPAVLAHNGPEYTLCN